MVYKKRKTYAKRASIAKQVKSVAKKVRIISSTIEEKVFTRGQDAIDTPSSLSDSFPYKALLNACIQGVDKEQRIGTKIRLTNLDLFISMYSNDNAFLPQQAIRVMIINVKTNQGASTIDLASVLGSSTPSICNRYNNWNKEFRKRYHVYYDRTFTVNGIEWYKHARILKKLSIIVDYNADNNNDATDIDKNALYLVCITDHPSPSDLYIRWDYNLFYQDA